MSYFGDETPQQRILDAIRRAVGGHADVLQAAAYTAEVLAYLTERAVQNPDASL